MFLYQIKSLTKFGNALLKLYFYFLAILAFLLIVCNSLSLTTNFGTIINPTAISLMIVNNLLTRMGKFHSSCKRYLTSQINSLLANIVDLNIITMQIVKTKNESAKDLSTMLYFDFETMIFSIINPQNINMWRRTSTQLQLLTDTLAFKIFGFEISHEITISMNVWILSITILLIKSGN